MKLTSALVGLAALGGVALSAGAASAMPIGVPAQASNVEQAAYVCNGWGRCWWRPDDGYGFYHPHYEGGWGWHRWHHWHGDGFYRPHSYGGWGWHRGHHWRRWHHW
jgi:hypothetical protein